MVMTRLSGLLQLQMLSLEGRSMDDDALHQLRAYGLRWLSLANVTGITTAAVVGVLKHSKRLQVMCVPWFLLCL